MYARPLARKNRPANSRSPSKSDKENGPPRAQSVDVFGYEHRRTRPGGSKKIPDRAASVEPTRAARQRNSNDSRLGTTKSSMSRSQPLAGKPRTTKQAYGEPAKPAGRGRQPAGSPVAANRSRSSALNDSRTSNASRSRKPVAPDNGRNSRNLARSQPRHASPNRTAFENEEMVRELAILKKKEMEMTAEINGLHTALTRYKTNLTQVEHNAKELKKDADSQKSTLENRTNSFYKLQNKYLLLKGEFDSKANDLNSANEQLKLLQKKADKAEKDLQQSNRKVGILEKQVVQLELRHKEQKEYAATSHGREKLQQQHETRMTTLRNSMEKKEKELLSSLENQLEKKLQLKMAKFNKLEAELDSKIAKNEEKFNDSVVRFQEATHLQNQDLLLLERQLSDKRNSLQSLQPNTGHLETPMQPGMNGSISQPGTGRSMMSPHGIPPPMYGAPPYGPPGGMMYPPPPMMYPPQHPYMPQYYGPPPPGNGGHMPPPQQYGQGQHQLHPQQQQQQQLSQRRPPSSESYRSDIGARPNSAFNKAAPLQPIPQVQSPHGSAVMSPAPSGRQQQMDSSRSNVPPAEAAMASNRSAAPPTQHESHRDSPVSFSDSPNKLSVSQAAQYRESSLVSPVPPERGSGFMPGQTIANTSASETTPVGTPGQTAPTESIASTPGLQPNVDQGSKKPMTVLEQKLLVDLMLSKCRHNQYEAVVGVLGKGVPINAQDEHGNTLLHVACQNGRMKIAKMCIDSGADVNIQNDGGNAPLHFCVTYGYLKLGGYLVAKGASTKIKNKSGLEPYDGLSRDDPAPSAGMEKLNQAQVAAIERSQFLRQVESEG
jgi:hypothetical protein